mgnify:CR=1 FL=1
MDDIFFLDVINPIAVVGKMDLPVVAIAAIIIIIVLVVRQERIIRTSFKEINFT